LFISEGHSFAVCWANRRSLANNVPERFNVGRTKEEEIADFNKLVLLAGKGDKEEFMKLLYERWDRMKQHDKQSSK
jgi:hypothetical protein